MVGGKRRMMSLTLRMTALLVPAVVSSASPIDQLRQSGGMIGAVWLCLALKIIGWIGLVWVLLIGSSVKAVG